MTALFCITSVNFSAETSATTQYPAKNCRPDHQNDVPAGSLFYPVSILKISYETVSFSSLPLMPLSAAPPGPSQGPLQSLSTPCQSISRILREKVMHEKKRYMICCVTNKIRNAHMWHEFANDGNGICIAVKPKMSDTIEPFKVHYEESRPYINNQQFKNLSPDKIAEEILKHKLSTFSNEDETRILKRVSDGRISDFLSVNIDRLYLGWNLSVERELIFREYARKANVKVIKLRKPIL